MMCWLLRALGMCCVHSMYMVVSDLRSSVLGSHEPTSSALGHGYQKRDGEHQLDECGRGHIGPIYLSV